MLGGENVKGGGLILKGKRQLGDDQRNVSKFMGGTDKVLRHVHATASKALKPKGRTLNVRALRQGYFTKKYIKLLPKTLTKAAEAKRLNDF